MDLDDEELEATRRLNGVAKENNINKKEIIELIDFSIGATGHRDAYTTGMCNGMEYIKSVITDTEPNYYECPKQDRIPTQKIIDKIKEIQKEEDLYAKNNIIKILEELLEDK